MMILQMVSECFINEFIKKCKYLINKCYERNPYL